MFLNEDSESVYGKIQFFILLPGKTQALAVVTELQIGTETAQLHFHLNFSYLDSVFEVVEEESSCIKLIHIVNIQQKVLYLDFNNCKCIVCVSSFVLLQD